MDTENSFRPEKISAGDEVTPEERLRAHHALLRRSARDFGASLELTPGDFPHRQRLRQLVDELLALVPVYNEEDERNDKPWPSRVYDAALRRLPKHSK